MMDECKAITNPVKVIRAHCIDCSGGSQSEADNCPCESCCLWPWRLGKNPYKAKRELTEEQKQVLRERLQKMREAQNAQLSPQT